LVRSGQSRFSCLCAGFEGLIGSCSLFSYQPRGSEKVMWCKDEEPEEKSRNWQEPRSFADFCSDQRSLGNFDDPPEQVFDKLRHWYHHWSQLSGIVAIMTCPGIEWRDISKTSSIFLLDNDIGFRCRKCKLPIESTSTPTLRNHFRSLTLSSSQRLRYRLLDHSRVYASPTFRQRRGLYLPSMLYSTKSA